jgi:site-specific DNA-cytosine methylase
MKHLAIDLFCGLGGWADGFLAEGYDVIGFDIERRPYPGQLVLQDVATLDGRQFRNAACIVASPPCQEYSYRAMPWTRVRALPPPDNSLFETCFRLQRDAGKAAGRHIPMVVENVNGAQKWVGRARWHFGSYYLWGDVPALMPFGGGFKGFKNRFEDTPWVRFGSRSEERKKVSAAIAKVPFDLAQYVARVFKPVEPVELNL